MSGNKAAVLHGIEDLRFQDWPLSPGIAAGHVRVAIKAVGICGSDIHYLQHGRIGDFQVTAPMVIGHESSGVVVQLGQGVSSLAVGDRVALEPGIPCWHCKAAREGRYNLDPGVSFFATPPVHGSLANYVDHPAELCYKLPANLSLEQGAMCEPLSVGVHACRRAQVQPGKCVAVLGAGPIGLVALLCARAFGADQVVITDVRQDNLSFAQRHYDAHTLLTDPAASPDTVARLLQQALAGSSADTGATAAAATAARDSSCSCSTPAAAHTGEAHSAAGAAASSGEPILKQPDVVLDCVGVQQTLEAAIRAVAPGGKVVLVGMGAEEMRLPATLITCKEIDLLGSFRYANTYPLCLSLLASQHVSVAPLITHRFGFSAADVAQGFDTAARAAQTGAIKVMFNLE